MFPSPCGVNIVGNYGFLWERQEHRNGFRAVNQSATTVSIDKGIGTYGFTPAMLQTAGFLKPGTLDQLQAVTAGTPTSADIAEATRINKQGGNTTPELVAQSRKATQMLTSPTMWTGLAGVNNLTSLLGNDKLQNTTQQTLMATTFNGLKTSGQVLGTEPPQDLGPIVQAATTYGVGAVDQFIKGTAPADATTNISNTIKSAQYSTSFVTDKLGSFAGFATVAASVVNTVNRAGVDSAVKTALNDAKIPSPEFKPVDRPADPINPYQSYVDKLQTAVNQYGALVDTTTAQLNLIYTEAARLDASVIVTKAQVTAIETRYRSVIQNYNSQNDKLSSAVNTEYSAIPSLLKAEADSTILTLNRTISLLQGLTASIKELIARLSRRAV